jgi:broad specificity phosphatase PhoE
MKSGKLILIRHGQPAGHDGRCIGHYDTELALSAVDGLHRLATSAVQPPSFIMSSDLTRAVESARALGSEWKAKVRLDRRLREMSFGNWEGRTWEDIGRRALDAWGADWTRVAPPNGESGVEFEGRVRDALNVLLVLALSAPRQIAVVSHAGWIRVATTVLLNEPLASALDRSIDYARAAVFTVSKSGVALDGWNVLLS